jgi:hypothetical protein
VLSQTDNPEKVLQQVARQIEKISDNIERNNIAASTGIIAGLVCKRSGGLKKKKDKPFPSSHKIRQLSKSHLHQNK